MIIDGEEFEVTAEWEEKPILVPPKSIKSPLFKIGEYVELIAAISDGYREDGDYNIIFPPPTIVQIVELKEKTYFCYGIQVKKEQDLPVKLRGKNFRTLLANGNNIHFIGNKPTFAQGDDNLDEKYFNNIYWEPEQYLKKIK